MWVCAKQVLLVFVHFLAALQYIIVVWVAGLSPDKVPADLLSRGYVVSLSLQQTRAAGVRQSRMLQRRVQIPSAMQARTSRAYPPAAYQAQQQQQALLGQAVAA
jgi:hypothetical protein